MDDLLALEVRAVSERGYDAEFERWLLEARHGLLRTAYLLCGEPHGAEDLLAAALAKVYLAWPRIEAGRTGAYARRVLVNEHRSLWRRAWRRREVPSAALPETAVDGATYDGAGDTLWAAVLGLPDRQRTVLVLRYYEQLTEAEAADLLGVSVGTVKSQCSRALAKLRSTLTEEGATS